MTNLDSKKTNAHEATELHDEELGQVAGGSDIETCQKCGTQAPYGVRCPNCGEMIYTSKVRIHTKS